METYYELIEEKTVIKKVAVSEMIDEFFKNGFQNSEFKELGRYETLEEGREALSNYKCSYSEASRNELYFHAYYLEEREEADGECESTGNYDFAEIEMESRYCIRYFKIHTGYSESEYLSHDEYVLEALNEMYQEDDDERLSVHLTYEDALKELTKYHCSYNTTQGRTKGYGDLEIEMYIISEITEEDGEWYIDRDLDRAKFLFEE